MYTLKHWALDCLVARVRGDRDCGVGFWDLKYLIRFGILPPPELEPPRGSLPLPPPWPPLPDPPPYNRFRMYEELFFDLTDLLEGDPSPQPNVASEPNDRSGLSSVLTDIKLRLRAANGLRERLQKGLDGLDQEIERLEELAKGR